MSIKREKLYVDGMVCESCEKIIEKSLKKVKGVKSARASLKEATIVITYDSELCSNEEIQAVLTKAGYSIISDKNNNDLFYIIGIVFITFIMLKVGRNSGDFNIANSLNGNVGFVALFIIGVLSSLHCVGMCGGIMMSQSISIDKGNRFENFKPALKYNLGRLISYTVLGGIVGGIGKVVSLSLGGQALITIIAGGFMVIMGMNIFGFKVFRKITIKLPWNNCNVKNNNTPFVVGLLNGFMPCGPLQTMQLYALGTGSIALGAMSMFFFALGTIPLMLGFGLVSNLLSRKNSNRLVKISGLIIIILGVSMTTRGLSLLGVNIPSGASSSSYGSNKTNNDTNGNKAEIVNGKQIVRLTANGYGYTPKIVYIQKNTPTEIIIEGERITSCNNEIVIPSKNISKELSSGTNTITFTSDDKDINYSCWMGMKRGVLKVVDDLNEISQSDISNDESESREVQFYGLPISKVETDRLIKIADQSEQIQKINITSSAGNFEPSVVVLNNSNESIFNFNMKDRSNDGVYKIFNDDLTEIIATFEIINGIVTKELPKLDEGVYGIIKDNGLYCVIEVYSDINKVDKESLRKKYF
ncbi:urease accessory protein UreH domain-containing protein [Clostridium sp.]|uniref:urease accessory protein UreH domain-containing protein n=1 Tax=Clostridium sp. TaxID=1506 RepID=UPI003F350A71